MTASECPMCIRAPGSHAHGAKQVPPECEAGPCTGLGGEGVLGGLETQIAHHPSSLPRCDALNEKPKAGRCTAAVMEFFWLGNTGCRCHGCLQERTPSVGRVGGGFLEEVRIQLGLKGRILLKTEEGRSKTCSRKWDSRPSRLDWWLDADRGPLAASTVPGPTEMLGRARPGSPRCLRVPGPGLAGLLQGERRCTRRA